MKKTFAILLALIMVLSLATTAFAAEPTHSITIKNSDAGHTYTAYQIFAGTISDGKLTEIVWGSVITDDGVALLAALKANNTIKDKFPNAAYNAEEIADILASNNTTAFVNAFADVVGDYIASLGTPTAAGSASAPDASGNYVIDVSTAGDGYYVVMDTAEIAEGHAATKYILKVLGKETVNVKTEAPTLDKEVQDNDTAAADDEWGETADYAIGDTVPFELTAKINADNAVSNYDTYPLYFTDKMTEGLTLNPGSIVVKVGEKVVDPSCYVIYTDKTMTEVAAANYHAITDNTQYTFIVWIKDAKSLTSDGNAIALSQPTNIYVQFTATLNENAVVGNEDDNKNTGDLWYDNNPNTDSWGSTPDDTVWVFTYKVDSTKYKDEVAAGKELNGAGFTLYTEEEYNKINDGDVGTVAVPVSLVVGSDGYYYPVAAGTAGAVTEMISDSNGKFNVKGLDIGTYYLVETTVPAGYNQCEDVKITISAEHSEETATTAKTEIAMTVNGTAASKNDVVNKSGTELPSTGGVGTTLFYIFGSMMVVGAAVVLVTKKRMGAAE